MWIGLSTVWLMKYRYEGVNLWIGLQIEYRYEGLICGLCSAQRGRWNTGMTGLICRFGSAWRMESRYVGINLWIGLSFGVEAVQSEGVPVMHYYSSTVELHTSNLANCDFMGSCKA